MKIMPAEIRATVPLYLDGKIQQWFTRGDGRGVDLHTELQGRGQRLGPSSKACLSPKKTSMDEQFIPVGPLLPLGILAAR